VPELNFRIDHLTGKVEGLLPWTELKNGHFKLAEKDSTTTLDFHHFEIEVEDSRIYVDMNYYIPPGNVDSLNLTTQFENLNPARIIQFSIHDTIPEFLDAIFEGALECTLALPEDSTIFLNYMDLGVREIYHIKEEDTTYAGKLQLETKHITYDVVRDTNPLATLSSNSTMRIEQIRTPLFQFDDLEAIIDVNNGSYTISTAAERRFGLEEKGKLIYTPFTDPPGYHLFYKVKELPLEDFLTSFYSEKIFSGYVDLELDLKFSGNEVADITSNMNGSIDLNGTQLTLHGLDLDNVIKNFSRSQSFNLLDFGAVIMAGPAGILYTKGSDYAMMLVANPGEQTTISQFNSAWRVDNGKIGIEDVAFATLENRVAAKGWVDMRSDSLDVMIAIIDESGCSLINQNIYGSSRDPKYSKLKIIKTLLAPVTKLLNTITLQDCDKFYEGKVQHPVQDSKSQGN
jgi:hypothetical protein